MYTLKTVFNNGVERLNYLGKNFEIVTKKESLNYFTDLCQEDENTIWSEEDAVYGFIVTPKFKVPLSSLSEYSIHTDKVFHIE